MEKPAVAVMSVLLLTGVLALAGLCPARHRLRHAAHHSIRHAVHRILDRWPGFRRCPPPDPFEALHVQSRLHVIAVEIGQLEIDDTVFARAARMEARVAAYDALLRNACQLAGVVDLDEATGRDGRMHRELELAERGWFW
jgi:hypothetical protein